MTAFTQHVIPRLYPIPHCPIVHIFIIQIANSKAILGCGKELYVKHLRIDALHAVSAHVYIMKVMTTKNMQTELKSCKIFYNIIYNKRVKAIFCTNNGYAYIVMHP